MRMKQDKSKRNKNSISALTPLGFVEVKNDTGKNRE